MVTDEKPAASPKASGQSRVLIVEVMRFIFSLLIISWHYLKHNYGVDIGAYIAVECFLIISGLLMYRQLGKLGFAYENAWKLTWKRAKSMWPVYVVGCLSVVISQSVFRDGLGILGLARKMLYALPELFYLSYANNDVVWYVQRMLIAGLVILFLLCVNKKAFVYCIAPISIWFIYWTLFQQWNGIQSFDYCTFTPLIQDTMFRAFAGLSLGVAAGALLEHLEGNEALPATKLVHRRGNLLGCVGLLAGFLLMGIRQYGLFELICIALFFFCVIGLFGGKDFESALMPYAKPIQYLGTLSFSLYVNQYTFDWIKLPFHPVISLLLILLLNLVYAVITYWAVTKFCKFLKQKAATMIA